MPLRTERRETGREGRVGDGSGEVNDGMIREKTNKRGDGLNNQSRLQRVAEATFEGRRRTTSWRFVLGGKGTGESGEKRDSAIMKAIQYSRPPTLDPSSTLSRSFSRSLKPTGVCPHSSPSHSPIHHPRSTPQDPRPPPAHPPAPTRSLSVAEASPGPVRPASASTHRCTAGRRCAPPHLFYFLGLVLVTLCCAALLLSSFAFPPLLAGALSSEQNNGGAAAW